MCWHGITEICLAQTSTWTWTVVDQIRFWCSNTTMTFLTNSLEVIVKSSILMLDVSVVRSAGLKKGKSSFGPKQIGARTQCLRWCLINFRLNSRFCVTMCCCPTTISSWRSMKDVILAPDWWVSPAGLVSKECNHGINSKLWAVLFCYIFWIETSPVVTSKYLTHMVTVNVRGAPLDCATHFFHLKWKSRRVDE